MITGWQPDGVLDVKSVNLVARRVCARYSIPLEAVRTTVKQEFMLDALCVQMDRKVWSQHLGGEVHRYPADWKEAIKERFAPAWFTRRWPVQYTRVTVDAYRAYPEIVMPSGGRSVFQVDYTVRPDDE